MSVPLPQSPLAQAWIFEKLRWRLCRNGWTQLIAHSRIKVISILLSSMLVAGMDFLGAQEGFNLVNEKIPGVSGLMELVLNMMFFALGTMLVFSSGLIQYASLFTGAETRFLLTTPARADQIFAAKFQTAMVYSSWAFVVLGFPILLAYGIQFQVHWHFYAALPAFVLGYILLPGGAGAIGCLLIVNFFPHQRRAALMLILGVVLIAGGIWVYSVAAAAHDGLARPDSLDKLFGLFTAARSPLSPSRWMAGGLVYAARGDWDGELFYLALIWSNGLFLYVIASGLSVRLYRRGYNRMSQAGGWRRRFHGVRLDRGLDFLLGFLHPKTRILIIKDFRTFRREPAQVGQLGIFSGLLLLGMLNTRQFLGTELEIPVPYLNGLSLVNLCAVGLLMCAYLARFIYPLISLEGRKFWILGLLPLDRDQLLWGKYAFSVVMTVAIASILVLVSDLFLSMPISIIAFHQLTVICLAAGLSGMAVGMSAWLPNFRETDPSKIISGFGGTMFTVGSVFFLGIIVGAVSVPCHIAHTLESISERHEDLQWWIYAGLPVGLAATIAGIWLPMRVGSRTLRRMEF